MGEDFPTKDVHTTDALLHKLGGCGIFQIFVTILSSIGFIGCGFSAVVMIFGSYDPGWRCLDDLGLEPTNSSFIGESAMTSSLHSIETISSNRSNLTKSLTRGEFDGTCDIYAKCKNIEFNPDTSTIVSEWGLICDKEWVPSTIIALQMGGMTVGFLLNSYVSDRFGRKRVIFTCNLIQSILFIISVFSVSWEMFAVLLFFIGVTYGVIVGTSLIYQTEFVTTKWRAIISGLPLWSTGTMIFAVSSMYLKDWKSLHIFNGVFLFIGFLPVFIVPESIRWLKINNKQSSYKKAVSQIAWFNRREEPKDIVMIQFIEMEDKVIPKQTVKSFPLLKLFSKDYLFFTLKLSLDAFCNNAIYFALSLDIASFPGNMYINNIIQFSLGYPANVIMFFAPNVFGRRMTGFAFFITASISMIISLCVGNFAPDGDFRYYVMLITALLMKVCVDMGWYLNVICANELFPTRYRGAAVGWVTFVAGIGSVISPYLIINEEGKLAAYIIICVCTFIGAMLYLRLPETRGKELGDDNIHEEKN